MYGLGKEYSEHLKDTQSSLLKNVVMRDKGLENILKSRRKRWVSEELFRLYLDLYILSCRIVEHCLKEIEILRTWKRAMYEINSFKQVRDMTLDKSQGWHVA